MLSKTTNNKKYWHHSVDAVCKDCNELTVFVFDHKDSTYLCTECNKNFKEIK